MAEGLRLIHQRLSRVLEADGVTHFESKRQQFDPTVHEAIGVSVGDEDEPGMVSEEVRRGYVWNGELLRPARVIVFR